MTKLKAPKFLDVIEAINQAGAVRVNDIAEATGCDYGPARRVLDLLADEGLILKVMRGERTFEYTPIESVEEIAADFPKEAWESRTAPVSTDLHIPIDPVIEPLGLGDRESDYPEDWLNAGKTSIETSDDDLNIWIIRSKGRKLGEVAELKLGKRIVYQIVSPWEPKAFDRMSAAIAHLD